MSLSPHPTIDYTRMMMLQLQLRQRKHQLPVYTYYTREPASFPGAGVRGALHQRRRLSREVVGGISTTTATASDNGNCLGSSISCAQRGHNIHHDDDDGRCSSSNASSSKKCQRHLWTSSNLVPSSWPRKRNNDDDATQRRHRHCYYFSTSSFSSPSPTPPPPLTEQFTSLLPPVLPDFISNITLWGGTGLLLTTFHNHLHLPYWACIALTNICVRSAMIPISIRGAQAQVKLSSVSPELQYLITSFTNDMKTLNAAGQFGSPGSYVKKQVLAAKPRLVRQTLATMRGLLSMKHVNLFDIFKSPLLQIPFFVYFASDLRRIIEGSNPALAQHLVESPFFWIADMTEPDPWYGLPIFTGLLLYMNVEVAVGKQSLGGEVSAKSNMAILLKDGFQSLAIFMPCFMSQQPSGVQLYLATSMVFTLLQSRAMRNDAIRQAIGLPSIHAKPRSMSDSDIVKEFLAKMAERQAAKARGGFILGEGVHVTGANISVPRFGMKRRSSIAVSKNESETQMVVHDGVQSSSASSTRYVEIELPEYTLRSPLLVQPEMFQVATPVPYQPGFVPGVFHSSGAPDLMKTDNNIGEVETPSANAIMPDIPLSVMEAANRGEKPKEQVVMAPMETLRRMQEENKSRKGRPIDADKLKSKWNRRKGKR